MSMRIYQPKESTQEINGKIHCSFRGSDSLRIFVTKERYQEIQQKARFVLESYPDYLYACDRYCLEKIVEGNWSDINPDACAKRAQQFVAEGIPGIFKKEYEGATIKRFEDKEVRTPFSIVDYYLTLVSGRYFVVQGNRARGARERGETNFYFFLPRADTSDVKSFIRLAFDAKDILNPLLPREILYRTVTKGGVDIDSNRYMEIDAQNLVAYYQFGEDLSELVTNREFDPYTPNAFDFKRLQRKSDLWFLHYSQKDRIRIAEDFLKRKKEFAKSWGKKPVKDAIVRLQFHFPELVDPSEIDFLSYDSYVKERVQECIRNNTYDGLPHIIFYESRWKEYQSIIMKRLSEDLSRFCKPDSDMTIFDPYSLLCQKIEVPFALLRIRSFSELVSSYRIKKLDITPQEIIDDYFKSKKGAKKLKLISTTTNSPKGTLIKKLNLRLRAIKSGL